MIASSTVLAAVTVTITAPPYIVGKCPTCQRRLFDAPPGHTVSVRVIADYSDLRGVALR
jgi:hypothetical protein